MKNRGPSLAIILGKAMDKKSKAPEDMEDMDDTDDFEEEETEMAMAAEFLEAIEDKDPEKVLEAFKELMSLCK